MVDQRDKRDPRPVPLHVRKQTAGPLEEERQRQRRIGELQRELEALQESGGGVVANEIPDFEARTPVTGDPFVRLEFRQRRSSMQLQNVTAQLGGLSTEFAKLEARHENLDEKIDQILKVEVDDRRAREQDRLAREQRAEAARIDLDRAKAAAEAEAARARDQREVEERKQAAELRKTTAGYRAKIVFQIVLTLGGLLSAYFVGRGG